MKYQDYYQILGVAREAKPEEIQRAYRKLARKLHPDVNKEKGAEDKFRVITEAYEVLKDPEKRKRYDALGSRFASGQDFEPPPGFDTGGFHFSRHENPNSGQDFDLSGFSDFFEMLFGKGSKRENFNEDISSAFSGFGSSSFNSHNQTGEEIDLPLTIKEIYSGGDKLIELVEGGSVKESKKVLYKVKLPTALKEGAIIRLSSENHKNPILFKVKVISDSRYSIQDGKLVGVLPIAPWEAALGGEVIFRHLDGDLAIKIPPGMQTRKRLRVKGKGLRESSDTRGELLLEILIQVPDQLSDKEKEIVSEWGASSTFNPRAAWFRG